MEWPQFGRTYLFNIGKVDILHFASPVFRSIVRIEEDPESEETR